jgi:hypothetical protein
LNPSGVPDPVQAPGTHPAQGAHAPFGHCASFVHQHGTPDAVQVPVGEATSLQLPVEQVNPVVAEVKSWQFALSATPPPVHDPVHWPFALTHLPLEQFESEAQRHAVWVGFDTGAGESGVVHEYAEAVSPVWVVKYP